MDKKDPEYKMLQRLNNGIMLSQEQMDLLDDINIDYRSCKTLKELIFMIDRYYNDTLDDSVYDLLITLSDRDYYENFKK